MPTKWFSGAICSAVEYPAVALRYQNNKEIKSANSPTRRIIVAERGKFFNYCLNTVFAE